MLTFVLLSIAAATVLDKSKSEGVMALQTDEKEVRATASGMRENAEVKSSIDLDLDEDQDEEEDMDEDEEEDMDEDEEDTEDDEDDEDEDAEKAEDTVQLALLKTSQKATKFNSQLQTAAQLDAGKLRISPMGEVLGHPSAADRNACLANNDITTTPGKVYSFNCAHRGDGAVAADAYADSNLITDQTECENSYTIRHRMDDQKFGASASPYTEDCSLRGEVQYCAWEKDSVACPGSQGGRDCGSAGKCMPSGATDFVCAQDKPILVDCKSNAGMTSDQVAAANGFGDDFTYGNPASGVTPEGATNP